VISQSINQSIENITDQENEKSQKNR